jgi:hypothetical protein
VCRPRDASECGYRGHVVEIWRPLPGCGRGLCFGYRLPGGSGALFVGRRYAGMSFSGALFFGGGCFSGRRYPGALFFGTLLPGGGASLCPRLLSGTPSACEDARLPAAECLLCLVCSEEISTNPETGMWRRSTLTRILACSIVCGGAFQWGCSSPEPDDRFVSIKTHSRGIHLGDSLESVERRLGWMRMDGEARYARGMRSRMKDFLSIQSIATSDGTSEITRAVFPHFLDGRLVEMTVSYTFGDADKSTFTPAFVSRELPDRELSGLKWEEENLGTDIGDGMYACRLELSTGGFPTASYTIWYRWFREEFEKDPEGFRARYRYRTPRLQPDS